MKTKYLLPAIMRPIGFIMAIPGLVLGYLTVFDDFEIDGFGYLMRSKSTLFLPAFENFTNELALLLAVCGLLFIAFARRKHEDELTAKLRLDALHWSVLCSYALFLLLVAIENLLPENGFIWNPISENGGLVYNLFMPLLIFVLRYYYLLYRNRDEYVVPVLRYFPARPYKLIGKIASPVCIALIVFPMFNNNNAEWLKTASDASYFLLFFTLIFWAFSKEVKEDEAISQLRLESLQLAVYINYGLLLFFSLAVYGTGFLLIIVTYYFSLLLFTALIFEYKKYKFNHTGGMLIKGGLLV